MDNCILRIEKLENGYEVEIVDDTVREANRNPQKNGKYLPYQDPWKGYAFTDMKSMLKFLETKIPELHPLDEESEYDDAFDNAVKGK